MEPDELFAYWFAAGYMLAALLIIYKVKPPRNYTIFKEVRHDERN